MCRRLSFLDNNMHDLKLERFYPAGLVVNDLAIIPDGPIKTLTLRGIKDSPPYLHDGRLLTLADTVEFFNLVLGLKLTQAREGCAGRLYVGAVMRRNPSRRRPDAAAIDGGLLLLLAYRPSGGRANGQPRVYPVRNTGRQTRRSRTASTEYGDRTFIHQLAIGNAAEIELGKLAQQKAQGQPAKASPRRWSATIEAPANVSPIWRRPPVLPLPSGLDDEHRALREHLDKLTGTAFDVAYIQGQIQDHQKTLHLLEYEIGSGQDQTLREFAADTLPRIRQHLTMAQNIALTVMPQAPQAATAPTSPTAPPATTPGVGPSAAPQTPPAQKPSGSR